MTYYVSTPILFTDSTTTASGLLNDAGYVLFPKVTFQYKTYEDINNTNHKYKVIPQPIAKHNDLYFCPVLPIKKEDLNCTTSGCKKALGFYYFSYSDFESQLYQIYSDRKYIYSVNSVSLDIYNLDNQQLICSKYLNDRTMTTITGDSINVYIGTTSGIYTLNKQDLYDNCNSTELIQYNIPLLFGKITYIHSESDYNLLVCTEKSVEYFYHPTISGIHSYTYINNTKKCFFTKKALYYIVTDTKSSLHVKENYLTNWTKPTKQYITGSGIFEESLVLTDIYITEQTTTSGNNTIFCTTTSGLYIINEDTDAYDIYYLTNN